MAGPGVLEMDRFMRAVNLKKSAEILYADASPRLKRFFEVYSRGVNAYMFRYRDRLPMDLAASGYRPEYWKPEDSVLLFCLLNFGLAVNLQEEIAALTMAQQVGADKLPWLLPIYPDEPLPFAEAETVSYTHLDVYKRQTASLPPQPSSPRFSLEQHFSNVVFPHAPHW